MKIIFIRHGDPDYVNDSLTEKGWREAELLSKRVCTWRVTDFYCSPLGRAQDTASLSLQKLNRCAETLDWAQEFSYFIDDPITKRHGVPWDFVPSYWSRDSHMHDITDWVNSDIMRQNPDIAPKYAEVCQKLDELLASYGYVREDKFYRVPGKEKVYIPSTNAPGKNTVVNTMNEKNDESVIVIFCHLGIICLMLSYLLNIPFPLLVHGFFLPTTSVTVLSTEERWDNEAYFRVQCMGDVTHLLNGGEPISAAGSFTAPFQG